MTGTTNEGNGSFKEMRARGLLLFDPALHRHDRGWPHPPPERNDESAPKHRWKTAGIFHFPHHDEEAEPGNGGSC